MSGAERDQPGFYGKLPGLGDFVTRRLPAEFVQPWDLWLRESLAATRAQLGETWLDTYLTSPLWRFVLSPGLVGQRVWAGVLMPSVDRVGRYFPLTLACPLDAGVDPLGLLVQPEWFERAEALALTGLDDDWAIERFDAHLLALGSPTCPAPVTARPAPLDEQVRANLWRLPARSPADIRAACPALFLRALEQVFCGYSLWWSSGSDRVEPSFLACQGLPSPDAVSALLAGDWTARGWWQVGGWPGSGVDQGGRG